MKQARGVVPKNQYNKYYHKFVKNSKYFIFLFPLACSCFWSLTHASQI